MRRQHWKALALAMTTLFCDVGVVCSVAWGGNWKNAPDGFFWLLCISLLVPSTFILLAAEDE